MHESTEDASTFAVLKPFSRFEGRGVLEGIITIIRYERSHSSNFRGALLEL